MSVHTNPVPARSDLPHDATRNATTSRRPFAVHGTVLSVGALAWAAAIAGVGVDPVGDATGAMLFGIGSGLFQVGLLFLLRALWRTRALGTGRVARTVLAVEHVLVSLAIVSTLADAFQLSDLSQPGWAALDAFWPISMLGMFGIGVRIAIAGRWKGAARYWPLVAESWAVCVIPTIGIFGATAGTAAAVIHLMVGYTVLGVIVARKTDAGLDG